MSMDNNIDYLIKPELIKDIINLVHFEPYQQFIVSYLKIELIYF